MADELSDFDRAHLAFLGQRMTELESESRIAFKTLGAMFGIENLKPADITQEHLDRLGHMVVEQLRQSGNTPLADRYHAAYTELWRTLNEQLRFLTRQQHRTLTDGERAESDAVAAAADDASEHFERVLAETSAYLEGLDAKEGNT